MRRTLPNLLAIVLVAASALSLACCGRRGPLEPPPGAAVPSAPVSGTAGGYEAPAGEPAGQNTAASAEAPPPGAKTAPPRAPKPFLLDPLL